MFPGNGYHPPVGVDSTEDGARAGQPNMAAGDPAQQVDLGRVLTGLRHIPASSEPARVFTDLAAICVPALCDECLIEITERGGHRYRIRQPGPYTGGIVSGAPSTPTTNTAAAVLAIDRVESLVGTGATGNGAIVTVSDSGAAVTARFGSPPGGGPDYTGVLVCAWHHGYAPTEADTSLVGVLVDHATALVHRERITSQLTALDESGQVRLTLDATQRVAAATGILMALYYLTPTQARQLLARAGDRTHRTLREVADTVLHTGALPDHQAIPPDRRTPPNSLQHQNSGGAPIP